MLIPGAACGRAGLTREAQHRTALHRTVGWLGWQGCWRAAPPTHPPTHPPARPPTHPPTWAWAEVLEGVLRVDAALDGVALDHNVLLPARTHAGRRTEGAREEEQEQAGHMSRRGR